MKHYNTTILIVEDDPNDQTLIKMAFRANGVDGPIQCVGSGEEAIAYLMEEGHYADRARFAYPTFILTDLKMPQGDGFAVLEHLKSNPEWAMIPAVVLLSSSDPDDIKKSYLLGASSYHVKPSNLEGLRAQLKVLHDYWMTCQIPEVDTTGRHAPTHSSGKLGERFSQPSGSKQTRAGR